MIHRFTIKISLLTQSIKQIKFHNRAKICKIFKSILDIIQQLQENLISQQSQIVKKIMNSSSLNRQKMNTMDRLKIKIYTLLKGIYIRWSMKIRATQINLRNTTNQLMNEVNTLCLSKLAYIQMSKQKVIILKTIENQKQNLTFHNQEKTIKLKIICDYFILKKI